MMGVISGIRGLGSRVVREGNCVPGVVGGSIR